VDLIELPIRTGAGNDDVRIETEASALSSRR
jgi:hypothetical protein